MGKMKKVAIVALKDGVGKSSVVAGLGSALVGIAPTQLCEFETGRRELSLELLGRILQAIKGNGDIDEGEK